MTIDGRRSPGRLDYAGLDYAGTETYAVSWTAHLRPRAQNSSMSLALSASCGSGRHRGHGTIPGSTSSRPAKNHHIGRAIRISPDAPHVNRTSPRWASYGGAFSGAGNFYCSERALAAAQNQVAPVQQIFRRRDLVHIRDPVIVQVSPALRDDPAGGRDGRRGARRGHQVRDRRQVDRSARDSAVAWNLVRTQLGDSGGQGALVEFRELSLTEQGLAGRLGAAGLL